MDSYVVLVEGLESFGDIAKMEARVLTAASRAINETARRTRTQAARKIQSQVDFPSRYLSNSKDGRLAIFKYAKGEDLEAIIRGRERPTSLARFAKGSTTTKAVRSAKGVKIGIKPGTSKLMQGAFLMRLRAGNQVTDTQYNLGLAIRTKDGNPPRNAYKPKQVGSSNLWLLYGPSVNQVFRTVSADVSPDALNFLEREINRLLDLDL